MRALLVPDSVYWATGTTARNIARCNPWMQATICSHEILKTLDARGGFPGRPDVVHFLTSQIANELMPRWRAIAPCVVTMNHIEDAASVAPLEDADAVMTLCRQWHDELLRLGTEPAKMVMTSVGVMAQTFAPLPAPARKRLRARLGVSEDRLLVGFSAKRSSDSYGRKGIDVLVRAVKLALAAVPRVAFLITGPGWHATVREIRAAGAPCIYLPFIVDHADMAPLYAALDAYWVTSRIEGGPFPLLEAMASGAACISTPVGLAPEALEHGRNGFLVAFDDANAYAAITAQLAADAALRASLGAAARATIEARFTASHSGAGIRALYEIARARYARRTGRAAPSPDSAPLVPAALASWLATQEHLLFMRHLAWSGATREAGVLAWRAIRSRPADPQVWRAAAAHLPGAALLRAPLRAARRIGRLLVPPPR